MRSNQRPKKAKAGKRDQQRGKHIQGRNQGSLKRQKAKRKTRKKGGERSNKHEKEEGSD